MPRELQVVHGDVADWRGRRVRCGGCRGGVRGPVGAQAGRTLPRQPARDQDRARSRAGGVAAPGISRADRDERPRGTGERARGGSVGRVARGRRRRERRVLLPRGPAAFLATEDGHLPGVDGRRCPPRAVTRPRRQSQRGRTEQRRCAADRGSAGGDVRRSRRRSADDRHQRHAALAPVRRPGPSPGPDGRRRLRRPARGRTPGGRGPPP